MTTISRPAASAPNPLATAWERIWRARRLVERNIMVYRHQWIIILSGVFEPIFYLIGIGLGLGGFIPDLTLSDGREVSWREMAREMGFGMLYQSRIATAVSELTRNVVRYDTESRGEVWIRPVERNASGVGFTSALRR